MPRRPVSPPKPDASTEERILRAARQEFTARGMDNARMQAIATRAGVNKALIHYYFRTKQRLYEAVLKDILSTVWGSFRENLNSLDTENSDLRQVTHTLVASFILTLRDNPDFPPVVIREFGSGSKYLPQIAGELLGRFGDIPARLMSTINRDVKNRRLRKLSPVHIILSLFGMTAATFFLQPMAAVMYRRVTEEELAFDEKFYADRIDAITTILCDGILAGSNDK